MSTTDDYNDHTGNPKALVGVFWKACTIGYCRFFVQDKQHGRLTSTRRSTGAVQVVGLCDIWTIV
jgi:carbohydrate-selective porin OprB